MYRQHRFTAALVAALFCPVLLAASIEANGSAPLDAGMTAAREMAVQDALRQAALSQGAQVDSAQYMHSGEVSESVSLSAAPVSGKVKVLDEREEGGLYQVKVQVDPDPPAVRSSSGCAAPTGRVLRRRVVAAHFYVDHPSDASDLDALGMHLPHDLAQRLARRSNEFSARDAGRIGLLANSNLTEPLLAASAARQLASSEHAQFVVAGRVLSSAVTDRFPRPTFFGSTQTSQQGAYYTGPLSALLGPGVIYRPVAREFQLELWIYDGLTGSLLRTRQFSTVARGDVMPRNPPDFGSAAFWQSDYGSEINTLLNKVTEDIATTLSCIPFSARVLRADGGQVYLNAGGMDGLQVGDKMLVYRQRLSAAVTDPISGQMLGVPETLVGDVSVIQVQPNLSVAVAQVRQGDIQAGDLVRFIARR